VNGHEASTVPVLGKKSPAPPLQLYFENREAGKYIAAPSDYSVEESGKN